MCSSDPEGISFVKVDGQSAIPYYFENSLPVCMAARGMNEALESGASRMDGAVINCMGMAMENILARPTTAISRNSDDFCPDNEGGFSEHLLQNAYNSLYHNELYCCDWDMFWTMHKDAEKHSLLRAVSGGPVYVSDKPGATDPNVLKPLRYRDGELLMMDRAAKPTEDCVFTDPLTNGVLKLHNIASYGEKKAGGIAAYNLTDKKQFLSFAPADIPDLDQADTYLVYDYFGKKVKTLGRYEKYEDTMEAGGYGWFVILPVGKNGTCLGLLDKYAGFMAVESIYEKAQFVKPCLMDLLCISPFIRGGPPFGTAPTQAPVGAFLRAEGFPKRRCQFESVAAQRHLSPSPSCMACTSHFRRAALWDGPYDAAIRPQKQATSH